MKQMLGHIHINRNMDRVNKIIHMGFGGGVGWGNEVSNKAGGGGLPGEFWLVRLTDEAQLSLVNTPLLDISGNLTMFYQL